MIHIHFMHGLKKGTEREQPMVSGRDRININAVPGAKIWLMSSPWIVRVSMPPAQYCFCEKIGQYKIRVGDSAGSQF